MPQSQLSRYQFQCLALEIHLFTPIEIERVDTAIKWTECWDMAMRLTGIIDNIRKYATAQCARELKESLKLAYRKQADLVFKNCVEIGNSKQVKQVASMGRLSYTAPKYAL